MGWFSQLHNWSDCPANGPVLCSQGFFGFSGATPDMTSGVASEKSNMFDIPDTIPDATPDPVFTQGDRRPDSPLE